MAYQGILEDAPENTMAAFKKAVELGVNGLMVDVRMTKDKKFVLMHDDTVDRTTDGKGRVDQLLYDELRLYDAGSWKCDEFKGEKAPLLSEVLRFCKVNGLKLILDVKQFGMEKQIISLVKEQDMLNQVYFWGTLKNVKKLEPGLPIYNLVFTEPDEITKDIIDYAHTEKNHIAVKMINSDNREVLKESISKKADIVILDYPQLIMDIFHKDELNKVVYPDPVDYIKLQRPKPESIDEKIRQEETIYIRDELSTLVEIMQSKDSDKDDARTAALAITGLLNDDTTSILITLLKHKNPSVRRNAAWALGLRLDKEALNPLMNRLKDKDDEVRREAILAIRRISNSNQPDLEESKKINAKLLKILKDDIEPDVRYDAARTLGSLKDESSASQLIDSLLNDPDWNVKSACAGALGKIGDKMGIKPLQKILLTEDKMDAVWTRKRSAWALAEIGEDAIESLIEALNDDEGITRQRAGWALIKIGKPAVPALVLSLKNVNKFVREMAAWTLGWIRDDYAVNALKWALKDNDSDVRIAAVWALGRIGAADALESLETARKDKDPAVRSNVIESINRINENGQKADNRR